MRNEKASATPVKQSTTGTLRSACETAMKANMASRIESCPETCAKITSFRSAAWRLLA